MKNTQSIIKIQKKKSEGNWKFLRSKELKKILEEKNLDIKDVFCHTYNLEAFAKPFSTTNSEYDWFEVEAAFMAKVPNLAPTLQLRGFCVHQMTQPSQKLSHFSCTSFVTSCTVTAKLLCPWDFPGKSGLPFSTPGHLPDPGIEPASPGAPALVGRFQWAQTEPPGKPPPSGNSEPY